ncbi:CCR4-NOT transcription complex subunit 2 [Nematostella vectensis]|uniref:CCR4-NOT transcription complex subunit 2 n=1 Tax=Nematostella vectensis TaxID=45351 RepID=UPI00207739E5|nr:CCR4-NOT transcription complex subunit 2 [Nematostella vectensis]
MSTIGSMRKSKFGFENMDDDFNSAGMYFPQSGFPHHRSDKESSLLGPSSQQHLGGLYGSSGMGSPGQSQSNFYGSNLHSSGMPPGSSMQMPPGNQRGMPPVQHQFSRSISMPATSLHNSSMQGSSSSGMPSVQSSSALHSMVSAPGANTSSQQGSRGILSMGPRGGMGQMPSPGHIGSQTGLPKSSRAVSIPSAISSPSRSSPIPGMGMPPSQSTLQQQQQQSQVQRAFNSFSSVGSNSGGLPGFPLVRSQSSSSTQGLVGSGLQSLTSAFTPTDPSRMPSPPLGRRQPFQSAQVFRDFRRGGAFSGDSSSPGGTALDLSEFPTLTNRMHLEGGAGGPGGAPSRPSYGVVSKPAEPQPDFSILNEDFPALPGTSFKQDNSESSSQADLSKSMVNTLGVSSTSSIFPLTDNRVGSTYEQALKDSAREAKLLDPKLTAQMNGKSQRGIQTSPSGVITNIPKGMVTDQFGMIGLLTFIRAAETEPNLVTLALGSDLTTLGLNLNSPESLYHTFGSPFAESPCRPHEIDYHVPPEYRINSFIREKLAPIKLSRYGEDLLFYLYYTNGGDILQLAAAAELYARDWRYHKEERVWLTRAPGVEPQVKSNNYERGTYYFFDCQAWRKVPKEFHLEYDKLEEKPTLHPIAAQ